MQHYLLITLDGDVSENQMLPDSEQIQAVCDGDLAIYRTGPEGQFQYFTPIDETDTDNWTNVQE